MVRTYLKTSQAAELLGLSPCTLIDWRWQRKGPPWIAISRGCIRYDQDALEQWLEARTVHEILEGLQASAQVRSKSRW